MKKLYFIIAMALISLSNVLIAQPYTATLEHGTTTQVFYGNLAFNAANAAAVDGDVIVLSAGNLGSATISKKIKVIGTGHYPNPVNTIPTTVNVTLGPGSDSCLIEGITTGTISNTAPVRAVHISRCKITTINLSAGSRSCIIEGNVLYNINCYNNDTVNIIRNNIFSTSAQGSYTPALGSFYNGSIIENNVFYLHCSDIGLAYCIIRNNIIFSTAGCGYGTSATYGCLIQNNFTAINGSPGSFFNNSTNTVQNPYTGTITDIIIGGLTDFNYNSDYHITNPTLYVGTDGAQIGIYGGQYPYKEKAIPYNPQIVSKYIAPQTDANGNFQINIKVKAQNN